MRIAISIVFACALACGAVSPSPQARAQADARTAIPVVDVHVHLVGGQPHLRDFPGAVKAALEVMNRFRIAKALLLPPPQVDGQHLYDGAELAQALRGHSKRFGYLGGGGSLNPLLHRHADPAAVTEDVKRAFAARAREIIDAGAVGFGEMAGLHISARRGHPYEFVPADHPLMQVLAYVAAERNVPIDLHLDAVTGAIKPPQRFSEGSNPPLLPDTLSALGRLLAHHPKAKIIWAHGGSDPLGGAPAPMTNKLLTADGLDPAWRGLLQRHPDRFMIGSDSFFVAPGREATGPGQFFAQRNVPKLMAMRHALSQMPTDIARKIARDNAMRVYRLEAQ